MNLDLKIRKDPLIFSFRGKKSCTKL